MKKLFLKSKWLTCLLTLPSFVFGANNIVSKISQSANQQIEETGQAVASIINTITLVVGILWIVVMLLMAFFNVDALKNHAKLLFGALVIIGVVYGISGSLM